MTGLSLPIAQMQPRSRASDVNISGNILFRSSQPLVEHTNLLFDFPLLIHGKPLARQTMKAEPRPRTSKSKERKARRGTATAPAVGSSALLLPAKPFWFFDSMGPTGGECYPHSPRKQSCLTRGPSTPSSNDRHEILHLHPTAPLGQQTPPP